MPSKGGSGTASAPTNTSTIAGIPTQPTPRPGHVSRRRWWASSLLLLVTFVALGVAPMALTVRLLAPAGVRLPAIGPLGAAATPSPTATSPDLSLPRAAWVGRVVEVRAAAGSATTVAQLQPGFPVQIQAHATVGGATWDHIIWAGPTPATGGQGWVLESVLSVVGGASPAVGDAAALAPGLATTLQGLGATVALAVYYPSARQLYLANGDQAYTLGNGARTLVLAALLAHAFPTLPTTPTATAAAQPTVVAVTPTPTTTPEDLVARGDPAATALAYQQIGGAAGLSALAGAYSLGGIVPGPSDWTQTQATPRALTQFYATLSNLVPSPDFGQLDSAGRMRVLSLLSAASNATVATPVDLAPLLAPPIAGAHETLVVGVAQEGSGWTVTVAGIVTLPNNATYVIAACDHNAATRAAGEQALQTLLTSVATLTQG